MNRFAKGLLAGFMALALTACSSGGSAPASPAADESNAKIGIILVGDENEGYTYAHMEGIREAAKGLGIADEDILWKYTIGENQSCYDAAVDLIENGATLVISNSYGHQSYMQQAAQEYPDVTFVADTGDTAAISGLANFKNAFTSVYESRYVSGVVAGMKLAELSEQGLITEANMDADGNVKIGYVGAFPYAEVVSGYTAFYLGVKSVVSNVSMYGMLIVGVIALIVYAVRRPRFLRLRPGEEIGAKKYAYYLSPTLLIAAVFLLIETAADIYAK